MKILVLLSRFPYPLEKGDKLRAYHQIKELSENNEIVLVALSDRKVKTKHYIEVKKYCKHIEVLRLTKLHVVINLFKTLFSGLPFQVGYFYVPTVKSKIEKIVAENNFDVIFCQLIRMTEYVKNINTTKKLLDYMDVFSKGMERRANKTPFPLKKIVEIEYQRLLKYEAEVFEKFDYKIIISEQDKMLIPVKDKNAIKVVPNGVDTDYFFPVQRKKEYELLFAGNMNYPPNIESALFIIKEILPLVQKKYPNLRLLIAGIDPAPVLLKFQSDNIHFTGWVEDIRKCFACSKIMLAPMLISIGLQNKILQAMAMKIPCISSELANNAIRATVGESILVANAPQEYADLICKLLENQNSADYIAENAYNFIINNYNWSAINKKLEKIIQEDEVPVLSTVVND
jgi:sugar transferase (PEP-CTERM/EpsH1 system associated)